MLKRLAQTGLTYVILAAPLVAFADIISSPDSNFAYLKNTVRGLASVLNLLIPFLMILALVAFFWGLVKYIFSAEDEEAKATGKRIMIGGIIALFVMAAVWGLVGLLASATGVDTISDVTAPNLPKVQ